MNEPNWDLKDIRIIRQNALRRAVELAIAEKITPIADASILQILEKIKETAEIFVHYIWFGLPNGLVTNDMTENKPKTFENKYDLDMNPQQKIVFEKIVGKYLDTIPKINKTKLKELIITKFGKLPTVESSINTVLKKIKPEEVELLKEK